MYEWTMGSKIEVCSTLTCGRPFQVNMFAKTSLQLIDPGHITCPHCGTLQAGDPESVFMTHALAAHEETWHTKLMAERL
jgi:hypothetical protein